MLSTRNESLSPLERHTFHRSVPSATAACSMRMPVLPLWCACSQHGVETGEWRTY